MGAAGRARRPPKLSFLAALRRRIIQSDDRRDGADDGGGPPREPGKDICLLVGRFPLSSLLEDGDGRYSESGQILSTRRGYPRFYLGRQINQ